MRLQGGAGEIAAMQTTTRTNTGAGEQVAGLAGRRFSKAKSITGRLGISPRTLFRWADAGFVTRHKINARVVLFDEAEVVAFIDSARLGHRQSAG